jgi:circadian clock protein KaiC
MPTGIDGLDEITGGGFPLGRPTLVCGGAGCGKTLLAMEFLVHGALQFNEPGLFMSFEESASDLTKNVASLGFDLDDLVARRQLRIDCVQLDPIQADTSGEYNLDGLFIRLENGIRELGAKRVVLDTVEILFDRLPDTRLLRSELQRLFKWLKTMGVTAVITAERGDTYLTRQGLDEYVSDCVIVLDHRTNSQVSTRRLHIMKYRGTTHGSNEYPFLIDEKGISVLPITSLGLQFPVTEERISSGIPRLDAMMGVQGYFRGSTVLVSGTAGSGKTSLAASFVHAACQRGERALFFAFEESPFQIIRNMRSIGMDLAQWVENGLLQFHANRPTFYGLEMHLVAMHKAVAAFKPTVVVVDPLTGFDAGGSQAEIKSMLLRLVDFLKSNGITALLTSLTSGGGAQEHTDLFISSLIDTWLLLRDVEWSGERNRALYLLKSRGMAHSNQIREFLLTEHGVEIMDPYLGPSGVLTGSARLAQEAKEQAETVVRQEEIDRQRYELERKRAMLEAQISLLRAEFEAEEAAVQRVVHQHQKREAHLVSDRDNMARSRRAEQ